MPDGIVERVDQIHLGREAKQGVNLGFQIPDLSTLQTEAKIREKNLGEQKKEIDKAIKNARENPLPQKTQARFDREFGKTKEKNAFKTVIVLFAVAIIITFFMQPSLFFIETNNQLNLVNYSQREIKNVSIYSLNEYINGNSKPIFRLQKLPAKATLPMMNNEVTILVAFAERQMPAIGVYSLENQNFNNSGDNNYKTQQTLKDMINEMN